MKCYVINMDNNPARLVHCEREFARVGLSFIRFPARTAAALADEGPDFRLTPIRFREWVPGEIGCLLSHLAIWKEVASGQDEYCAIFEDDILLSPVMADVAAGIGNLPGDTGLVKLETYLAHTSIGKRRIKLSGAASISLLLSDHLGAAGYIISRDLAADLVKSTSRSNAPADVMLFSRNEIRNNRYAVYQAVPAVCVQEAFLESSERDKKLSSVIAEERWKQLISYKTPFATRLLNRARRIMHRLADHTHGTYGTIPFLDDRRVAHEYK
jgi:glycosyl transferase family 25